MQRTIPAEQRMVYYHTEQEQLQRLLNNIGWGLIANPCDLFPLSTYMFVLHYSCRDNWPCDYVDLLVEWVFFNELRLQRMQAAIAELTGGLTCYETDELRKVCNTYGPQLCRIRHEFLEGDNFLQDAEGKELERWIVQEMKAPAVRIYCGKLIIGGSPLWSLLKLHLQLQRYNSDPVLPSCFCLRILDFYPAGCPHQEESEVRKLLDVDKMAILPCNECSYCLRCHGQLGCSFVSCSCSVGKLISTIFR